MRFVVDSILSVEEAFGRVADFGKLDRWDPFVRSVRLLAGDPFTVGATYLLRAPGGFALVYELRALEPPRLVRYAGGTSRGGSTDTIRVARRGAGSRVTIESTLEFRGWVRLIGPAVRLAVWGGGRLVSLPALRRYLNPP